MNTSHLYTELDPDRVIRAVESVGLVSDGRLLPLNSYENRVYQVGIDGEEPVVAKFYRPGRWSEAQLLEEHQFIAELAEAELPVVAPLADAHGRTLHHDGHFAFTLYPRRGGRQVELDLDTLHVIGRALGQLHAVGSRQKFRHRLSLGIDNYGTASCRFVLEHDFIPSELRNAYETLTRDLLQRLQLQWREHAGLSRIRLHGDFHRGNILWREGPLLVDFDDCLQGPAVQDLWMLLSGERDQQQAQLSELIDGYAMFHDFNPAELGLIETLRTLRMMHYSAWLARRWDDPAFPHNFPWFNTARYWADHVLQLREQLAALDEQPLRLF